MNLRPFRNVVVRIRALLRMQSPTNPSSTPPAGEAGMATAASKIPVESNTRIVLLRPEHGIPLGGSVISLDRLSKALPESTASIPASSQVKDESLRRP